MVGINIEYIARNNRVQMPEEKITNLSCFVNNINIAQKVKTVNKASIIEAFNTNSGLKIRKCNM